jgi:hypothetical protein
MTATWECLTSAPVTVLERLQATLHELVTTTDDPDLIEVLAAVALASRSRSVVALCAASWTGRPATLRRICGAKTSVRGRDYEWGSRCAVTDRKCRSGTVPGVLGARDCGVGSGPLRAHDVASSVARADCLGSRISSGREAVIDRSGAGRDASASRDYAPRR